MDMKPESVLLARNYKTHTHTYIYIHVVLTLISNDNVNNLTIIKSAFILNIGNIVRIMPIKIIIVVIIK